MTEPDDQLPIPPPANAPGWLRALLSTLNAYLPLAKELVVTLGVLATLGTSLYTMLLASHHSDQIQQVQQQQTVATDAAKTAAVKAAQTNAVTSATLTEITGDPNAPAEAIHAATTQGAK